MRRYKLTHLSDTVLLRRLATIAVRDRITTASLLAHIAEVDARRLYLPAGYPSMHAYCIDALHLSEDAAYKRIQAARAAREFPALFRALTDGRLHLSGMCLLAAHLTADNVEELLAAATYRRKFEIALILAARFSPPELSCLPLGVLVGAELEGSPLAPGQVAEQSSGANGAGAQLAPGQVESAPPAVPVQAANYLLRLTIPGTTHEKLRYAQALLAHAIPSGDAAEIVDRALDALIDQLERRKFAATSRPPRERARGKLARRTVPAPVKRTVWKRDEGQCTFVSDDGHRCATRARLEFDHVDPVGRGGRPSAERMRLLCRAHNQFEAERVFGEEFMSKKRRGARVLAAEQERVRDVAAALRGLGLKSREARRAADASLAMPHANIEDGIRAALQCVGRGPG